MPGTSARASSSERVDRPGLHSDVVAHLLDGRPDDHRVVPARHQVAGPAPDEAPDVRSNKGARRPAGGARAPSPAGPRAGSRRERRRGAAGPPAHRRHDRAAGDPGAAARCARPGAVPAIDVDRADPVGDEIALPRRRHASSRASTSRRLSTWWSPGTSAPPQMAGESAGHELPALGRREPLRRQTPIELRKASSWSRAARSEGSARDDDGARGS